MGLKGKTRETAYVWWLTCPCVLGLSDIDSLTTYTPLTMQFSDVSGESGGVGKEKSGLASACACCAMCGACAFCCVCVLVVIAIAGLGIAKIVIGAVYLHDCDLQYLIPIYLIVSGCAPILFGGSARQQKEEGEEEKLTVAKVCQLIGLLFGLAWLICGSIWTYGTWAKVKADDYIPCGGNVTTSCEKTCDDVVLTFSFAMVTIDWVFIGLYTIFYCCTVVKFCCKKCSGSE